VAQKNQSRPSIVVRKTLDLEIAMTMAKITENNIETQIN